MAELLEWTRVSAICYRATDNTLRYKAVRNNKGIWRVRMNGELIGEADGFASFEEAMIYVEWGGNPNRMGYDRETGELQ
jgi:hypothetical protein